MTKALIHAIFQCRDCEKHWENYLTAQSLARLHVEQSGHTVSGELGYSVEYISIKAGQAQAKEG